MAKRRNFIQLLVPIISGLSLYPALEQQPLDLQQYTGQSHSVQVDFTSDQIVVDSKNFPLKDTVTQHFDIEKYKTESQSLTNYHTQITQDTEWLKSKLTKDFPDYTSNILSEIVYLQNFVLSLRYKKDIASNNSLQYTRHPIETLVEGEGDCDDKVALLYQLLKTRGYSVGYVSVPNHMLLMIPRKTVEDFLAFNENIPIVHTTPEHEYVFVEATQSEPIGTSNYSVDDILYTYSEEDGFTMKNIENIHKYIAGLPSEFQTE